MTTADALRVQQLQDLAELRAREREAARRLMTRLASRHGLSSEETAELLHICGPLGEVDEGTPVVLPDAFNRPTKNANLSAPAAGTYG